MPTLTREELYTLVWTEPIQKIAPRYNLSDRGLAKLCARYNIPVPPRGYWAKKAAGKRVRQAPLPPDDNPYRQKIRLQEQAVTTPEQSQTNVHPLVAFEQEAANQLRAPETLPLTHSLVLKPNAC